MDGSGGGSQIERIDTAQVIIANIIITADIKRIIAGTSERPIIFIQLARNIERGIHRSDQLPELLSLNSQYTPVPLIDCPPVMLV